MATPSDPIEDLKRAVELIRQATGERDPRCVVMSAATWNRIRAMVDEQRRVRRHRVGIDS